MRYECLLGCGVYLPPAEFYSSACFKRLTQELGPDWLNQLWTKEHIAAIQRERRQDRKARQHEASLDIIDDDGGNFATMEITADQVAERYSTLREAILKLYLDSNKQFGSRRIYRARQAEGWKVSRPAVARWLRRIIREYREVVP